MTVLFREIREWTSVVEWLGWQIRVKKNLPWNLNENLKSLHYIAKTIKRSISILPKLPDYAPLLYLFLIYYGIILIYYGIIIWGYAYPITLQTLYILQ